MLKAAEKYLKKLEEMLFGIPENVPPRYQRYAIASNFMFVFALVGHFLFIPVHWFLGSPLTFAVNTLCVPLDGLCLFLNHRNRYKTAFSLWVSVMALHTAMAILAYGWSSGFHYYLLSLALFIFIAPWKKSVNVVLTCAVIVIYLWLNNHTAAPAFVDLSSWQTTAARITNIVINFAVLCYLANYYAAAAEKTQNSLEENEKTLNTILAASPVGIALVKYRKIFWANETLARMMGYENSRVMNPDTGCFFPDENELNRLERLAYDSGRSHVDLPDMELLKKDGGTFPCHLKIRPILPGNRDKGSIVVVMDISAQKEAEREKEILTKKIQRAEKMEAVGTMAGGVAHDLNNILSGILSYPELLLRKLPPHDPMKKSLEVIKQCGEKAAAIVQDLLTLTRRGVHVKQAIDLNATVSDYLTSPEHENLKKRHAQVSLKIALWPEPVFVSGSPIHLLKTVMNLVANAYESMPHGGEASIAIGKRNLQSALAGYEIVPPGLYVVLSIRDRGHGISKENLERIFEPFYTKKVMGQSGTGLGLAVVWGAVKDSGGYVDVVSAGGTGTRFDLYLPATGATDEPAGLPQEIDSYRGAGQHILVVDDMLEQRMIAVGMLEELGYRSEAVSGGHAAVAWIQKQHTDLLLLDMIMEPGMDGLETYRRILEHDPAQRAVIVSGYSETRRVSDALSLGAARYLKKPYTYLDLAKAVKAALNQSAGAGGKSRSVSFI